MRSAFASALLVLAASAGALAAPSPDGQHSLPPGNLTGYTAERLESLQAQDRTIVLHFFSESCRVCASQERVIGVIVRAPGKHVPAALQAHFDIETELDRLYEVTAPSTILVFKGKEIIGKSVGMLNEADIRALIRESRVRARARPKRRPKRAFRPKR